MSVRRASLAWNFSMGDWI
jgi:hypothetical protein